MSKFFRKDGNHDEICEYLRNRGIEARDCAAFGNGFLDLLTINLQGEVGILEIKTDTKSADFKYSQLFFAAYTRFNIGFCKTKEQAKEFAESPKERGLSQRQKDKIAFFLIQHPNAKKFSANTIYKLLGMEK